MNMKYVKRICYFLVILLFLNNINAYHCPVLAASKKIPSLIVLSCYSKTVNIGDEFRLGAIPSNGSFPKWKSSNSRVASVNTYGLVTAKKAGSAKITAKISGAEASCRVTVKKTAITLNKTTLSLENGETFRLHASTSNGSSVQFKSSKRSVASVSDSGEITAEKPGTAKITVSADGTKAVCRITVKKPAIHLRDSNLKMVVHEAARLKATTSSGLALTWKSSKKSVADVDDNGVVYAYKPGTTRISVSLDGVKKYCTVKVTK